MRDQQAPVAIVSHMLRRSSSGLGWATDSLFNGQTSYRMAAAENIMAGSSSVCLPAALEDPQEVPAMLEHMRIIDLTLA